MQGYLKLHSASQWYPATTPIRPWLWRTVCIISTERQERSDARYHFPFSLVPRPWVYSQMPCQTELRRATIFLQSRHARRRWRRYAAVQGHECLVPWVSFLFPAPFRIPGKHCPPPLWYLWWKHNLGRYDCLCSSGLSPWMPMDVSCEWHFGNFGKPVRPLQRQQ